MMETLAIHIRQNPRIKGIEFNGQEKKLSLAADDSLLVAQCSENNLNALHITLTHFQVVSGLKINFDKSSIIPLNDNPQWLHFPVVQKYNILSHNDHFRYLGTLLSPAMAQGWWYVNFPFNENLIKEVMSARCIRNTCLSGRILQSR